MKRNVRTIERSRSLEKDSTRKTRQGRSANRGVLWTRLTARAGHGRVVRTEGAKGVSLKREMGRGGAMPPQDRGRERGKLCGNEGEGGRRMRRRLDAVSVDIHLLYKMRESRGKTKSVYTYISGRWRRRGRVTPRGERRPVRMIGWQLYPLSEVSEEVSGNRCRFSFAKHGPALRPRGGISTFEISSLCRGKIFLFRLT